MTTTLNRFQFRQTECWTYPKFSTLDQNAVDQATFFSFLDKEPNGDPLRLYLHIPYCKQFCSFCPYYKKTYGSTDSSEKLALFDAFAREMAMYAARPQIAGRKVASIYFGGGDPGVISTAEMDVIWKGLRDNFEIDKEVDITTEGTAMSFLDVEKLEYLKSLGVTRASFGVQTFDETIRPQLNLEPTVDQIYQAAENIRKVGFRDLSIDMMYNLPGQSEQSFYRDLDRVHDLGAKYIDFYALNLYPNTTYLKKVQKGSFGKKPTNDVEIMMWGEITRLMGAAGYSQVSSVTFSRTETKPHLGFDHTLRGYPMLGIGPSSRSYVAGRNFRNHPSNERYIEDIMGDRLPIETVSAYSEIETENMPFVFFPIRLHLDWSVVEASPRNRVILENLIEEEFIERCGDTARLTAKGRVWAGNIQRIFFSEDERQKEKRALLNALKLGRNPYNQDHMGVSGRRRSQTVAHVS